MSSLLYLKKIKENLSNTTTISLLKYSINPNSQLLKFWIILSIIVSSCVSISYILNLDLILIFYILMHVGLAIIGSSMAYHISLTDVLDRITIRISSTTSSESPKMKDLRNIVEMDTNFRQIFTLLILVLIMIPSILKIVNFSTLTRLIVTSSVTLILSVFFSVVYTCIRGEYTGILFELLKSKSFSFNSAKINDEFIWPWYKLVASLAGFTLPLQAILHIITNVRNTPFILALFISTICFFALSLIYDNTTTRLVTEINLNLSSSSSSEKANNGKESITSGLSPSIIPSSTMPEEEGSEAITDSANLANLKVEDKQISTPSNLEMTGPPSDTIDIKKPPLTGIKEDIKEASKASVKLDDIKAPGSTSSRKLRKKRPKKRRKSKPMKKKKKEASKLSKEIRNQKKSEDSPGELAKLMFELDRELKQLVILRAKNALKYQEIRKKVTS